MTGDVQREDARALRRNDKPTRRAAMRKILPLFVAFVATVYGANWAVGQFGIIDVGFGLEAPAGVLFAGLALSLRDGLRETAGRAWRAWVLAAIAAGAVLSYFLADAITAPDGFVIATAQAVAWGSAVAFTISELLDALVYERIRRYGRPKAVAASNVIGAVVDSALFLWLVFGSLDFIQGQVLAKLYVTAATLLLIGAGRYVQARRRPSTAPAFA